MTADCKAILRRSPSLRRGSALRARTAAALAPPPASCDSVPAIAKQAASMFTPDTVVTRSVTINAPPARVWAALTLPDLMKTWMFPGELDIATSWEVGAPFVIRGKLHGVAFTNKGRV